MHYPMQNSEMQQSVWVIFRAAGIYWSAYIEHIRPALRCSLLHFSCMQYV